MSYQYFFLITPLIAQAAENSPGEPIYFWTKFLVMVFVLFIAYQLMSIPEKRRQKEIKSLIESLKIGDTVITTSGIVGEIEAIQGAYMTLKFPSGYSIVVLLDSALMIVATDKFPNKES